MGQIVSDKDLYADADDKLVAGDSADAAFLVARAGTPIPETVAERYDIKGKDFDQGAALAEQEEARRQTLSEPSHGPAPKSGGRMGKVTPVALDPAANPPATR